MAAVTEKENYVFRPYKTGDEQGILNLWEIAFKNTMPLDRFEWKYLNNPYDQAMMLCIAPEGDVVTFYGGIPYRFQYQDRMVQGVQLMDIMSDPAHRTHKVFAKTATRFIQHFCTPDRLQFMYGFPGAFHYAIGHRILHYQKTTPAAYLECPVPDPVPAKKKEANERFMTMSRVLVEELDQPDWKRMWQQVNHAYPFSLVRDTQFLKWRFFDHPEKKYKVYQFIKKGQCDILGYVVLSFDSKKTVLVDCLIKDSFSLFKEMMNCLKNYLSEKEMQNVVTWLPDNHFLTRWCKTCGWMQQDEPTGIIPTVALFSHSPSLDWVNSTLFYTMADADLF